MFQFIALQTDVVRKLQNGGLDAYGNVPESAVSDGDGVPCRHCLKMIPKNERYLCLSFRPFERKNAFTETGPIFICAKACERAAPSKKMPDILCSSSYIARGYSKDERIVYGSGGVILCNDIPARIEELFENPKIEFVDVRSAANNCFHCRALRKT